MNGKRKRSSKQDQRESSSEEWPEKMNLTQARQFLGISFSTLSILVGSGKIDVEEDPLDRRVRLVKRTDLEKILRQRTRV
jgi:predicted site-specific integrase-resolvase